MGDMLWNNELNHEEIFSPEYTKKIKVIAKIYSSDGDDEYYRYLLQSHEKKYELCLMYSPYEPLIKQTDITFREVNDYFDDSLNFVALDRSSFYVPTEQELKIISNRNNIIQTNLFDICTEKHFADVDEHDPFELINYIDFMSLLGKEDHTKDGEKDIDYINTFLRNTKSVIFGSMLAVRPAFEFGDGTTLSIQASSAHYCLPRTDNASLYTDVECGMPNKLIPEIMEYAEDSAEPLQTVYGFVPVPLLNDLVKEKGLSKNTKEIIFGRSIER